MGKQSGAAHVTMVIDRQGVMACAVDGAFRDLDSILDLVDRGGITEPITISAKWTTKPATH